MTSINRIELSTCNLYNLTPKDWANEWAMEAHERRINPMPSYEIYPDQMTPMVRNRAGGKREIALTRWGLPSALPSRLYPRPACFLGIVDNATPLQPELVAPQCGDRAGLCGA